MWRYTSMFTTPDSMQSTKGKDKFRRQLIHPRMGTVWLFQNTSNRVWHVHWKKIISDNPDHPAPPKLSRIIRNYFVLICLLFCGGKCGVTYKYNIGVRIDIHLNSSTRVRSTKCYANLEMSASQFSTENVTGRVVSHDSDLLFRGQILKSVIFRKFCCDFSLQTVTDTVKVTIFDNEWQVIYGFRMAFLHSTLFHSKSQGQRLMQFDNEYHRYGDTWA